MAFYQQGTYTRSIIIFTSITLSTQLWAVQHILLFMLSSFPFFFSYQLSVFLLPPKLLMKSKSPDLRSRFFFKIIQHCCKTWNVIGLFPSKKRDPGSWEDPWPRTQREPRTQWGDRTLGIYRTQITPPIKYSFWLKWSKILYFI